MITRNYACSVKSSHPIVNDPILQEIDWILDDPKLFALIYRDLNKHYKKSRRGRPSIPVEVTLRMIVLRRYKDWTYREVEQEVDNSASYRWWTRVYNRKVPDHSTLEKLESKIDSKTLHQFNDRLVAVARTYHIIKGYRLRVDSSVTESNIRYPMDNNLLSDGVRVLSRLIERVCALLPLQVESAVLYSDHTLIAKRRCKLIARLIHSLKSQKSQKKRRETEKALNKAYKELVDITNITLTQVRKVVQALQNVSNEQIQRVVQSLLEFIPLVERVVEQTIQRVFQNKRVPAESKVVSLFEPHTQIIQKGKGPPNETEFGHKVNYGESDGKFVIHWQVVLEYNPPDDKLLPSTLLHYCKLFGHAPHLLATDSGMFSPENEKLACELGVEQIAIIRPKRFASKNQNCEKESWFRKGQRFRNGIEGRISVLHRTVHLSRCPYRGVPGFKRWIGWGIITANLVVMGRSLRKRKRKTMKK